MAVLPDSVPPARPRRGPGSLRLIWVYPDLLSTYGDRGNLLVLKRRARLRGIECWAPYAEAFHCAKSVIVATASPGHES